MYDKIPLLVVCGPTASGKTRLAVDLAAQLDGEIIGADSMQVYRYMDIGTAKPTLLEKQGIPHHLIDFLEPSEKFSVARYVELAREKIADTVARGHLPILAGGTGLYISSLIDNVRFGGIDCNPALREELQELARQYGNAYLLEKLCECDPDLAEKLHPNNLGRIIRALEVYKLTGITMSEHQKRSKEIPSEYNLCMLGLCYSDREKLYERINLRVEQMLEQGLLKEAKELFDSGYAGTATQAIGYKELWKYFSGMETLEEAAENLKRETRRYAKRQMTWFRRDDRIRWLCADVFKDYGALLDAALKMAKTFINAGGVS